jgi:O-antigen ligase
VNVALSARPTLRVLGGPPETEPQPRASTGGVVLAAVTLVALTLSFTVGSAVTLVAGEDAARLAGPVLLAVAAVGALAVAVRAVGGGVLRDVGLACLAAAPLLVSTALSGARGEGSYAVFAAAEAAACILLVSSGRWLDVRAAATLALAMLVGISLVAALAVPQLAIPGRDFLPVLYDGRVGGVLEHPNGLGLVSGLLVLSALSIRGRRLRAAAVVLGALGLAASASQTSTIATVIALVVTGLATGWLHVRSASGRLALLAAGLAVVVLVVATIAYTGVLDALVSGDTVDTTLSGRTDIWSSLLGSGSVPALGLGHYGTAQLISDLTRVGSTHNVWIDAYLVDGVAGILALGVAIVAFVWGAVRELRRGSAVGLGVLVGFLVVGVTESGPTHPAFYLLVAAAVLGFARR